MLFFSYCNGGELNYNTSIRVSEYLTGLPPIKLLQARLHQAIERA
jgi:hypothetical protein